MRKALFGGIQKIFTEAAPTYELANSVLTLGLDTFWRKRTARMAAQWGGDKWLDVCSGTGETAAYLRGSTKGKAMIVALDFCFPMLHQAVKKAKKNKINLCIADAGRLPFNDNTFDLVTISFATRNLNINRDILIHNFREFYRIIKSGGRFVNLETSQPVSIFLRRLFHFYVRLLVKPVGYLLSGSKAAYAYLSYTIPRFFSAGELSEIIYRAGFRKVSFNYMSFGITAIHTALK